MGGGGLVEEAGFRASHGGENTLDTSFLSS